MISLALAEELKSAGLAWEPASGDWFVVAKPELTDTPFLVSEMTVEVQQRPHGRVIRFNGTTEWALDSVEEHEVVWLPTEQQLRERLGNGFLGLERLAQGFRVLSEHGSFEAVQAADAYARALLARLRAT